VNTYSTRRLGGAVLQGNRPRVSRPGLTATLSDQLSACVLVCSLYINRLWTSRATALVCATRSFSTPARTDLASGHVGCRLEYARVESEASEDHLDGHGIVAFLAPQASAVHVWYRLPLGLYKIFIFTSRLMCMMQSSVIAPPHPHCPRYCTTIARRLRNIRPPTDPPSVCHTP